MGFLPTNTDRHATTTSNAVHNVNRSRKRKAADEEHDPEAEPSPAVKRLRHQDAVVEGDDAMYDAGMTPEEVIVFEHIVHAGTGAEGMSGEENAIVNKNK